MPISAVKVSSNNKYSTNKINNNIISLKKIQSLVTEHKADQVTRDLNQIIITIRRADRRMHHRMCLIKLFKIVWIQPLTLRNNLPLIQELARQAIMLAYRKSHQFNLIRCNNLQNLLYNQEIHNKWALIVLQSLHLLLRQEWLLQIQRKLTKIIGLLSHISVVSGTVTSSQCVMDMGNMGEKYRHSLRTGYHNT